MNLFKTGSTGVLSNMLSGALILASIVALSACSNNKTTAADGTSTVQKTQKQGGWKNNKTKTPLNMKKVETGTIVSIKTIPVKPEKIDSYGNIGVSVGSGGHSGIYGAFDIATIGKVLRNANKPKTAQQFIIKRTNGEMVAITQAPSAEVFKVGEPVKLLLQNGKAKVIH